MSFLLPMAWWLGLLAGPVIAFYLLKTHRRRKPASTLLFWNQIKPKIENSPLWRKLRRWLSLLLQLLILALLVAALARPAFDWEKMTAQHVVAIVDPSASMQAVSPPPSRWVRSTEELESAIARLRPQDEMAILSAENPPRILSGWTSSQRTLRQALAPARPLPTGTDPTAAFGLARELTTTRAGTRTQAFSDSVWPAGSWSGTASGIAVEGVDAKPPQNAGLTLFAVRRSPVSPGDWQLDAEVASPAAFSGTLEIRRDGQPMDLTPLTAGPGASWKKSWRGGTEGGATFEAELKVPPGDQLLIDNRAACVLPALKPLRVVIAGPQNPFLEAVLESIPLVKWTRASRFPAALAPEDADLVIAQGISLPDAPSKVPLLLVAPARGGFWGQLGSTLKGAPVTDIDQKSPLLRHAGLNTVAIDEIGQWTPPGGSAVLASSMGHPLLFGQWDRSPRWLVVGFDPDKSDLLLRTAFPVLIGNLLQSLREDTDLSRSAALLPGAVETDLKPLASPGDAGRPGPLLPSFPGWWLALLAGLGLLAAEWFFYNKRITD